MKKEIEDVAGMLMELMAAGILLVLVVFGFAMLVSIPVWLLWNWLCPVLFGLPSVTLLQALGLSLLSGFLFRGNKSTTKKD